MKSKNNSNSNTIPNPPFLLLSLHNKVIFRNAVSCYDGDFILALLFTFLLSAPF